MLKVVLLLRKFSMKYILFEYLLLLFVAKSHSTMNKQYFGTRTTDGPNGLIYYSLKEVNVGYANEISFPSMNIKNKIFGVLGDGNKAEIIFSSNIYIAGTSTSVAITTIEYARDLDRLLCTFSHQGINKFGRISFTDTLNVTQKIAYITELSEVGQIEGSTSNFSDIKIKIGVSDYFTEDGTADSAYMLASWNSFTQSDSLWLIQTNQSDYFSIRKLQDVFPAVYEVAAITRHEARDIPKSVIAMDIISRLQNGEWSCATLQFGQYAEFNKRPDVYARRKNESMQIFEIFGSGSYSISESRVSMKINNGIGLFYTLGDSYIMNGTMSTLLRPRLSTSAFNEPKKWGYTIAANLVLPISSISQFNETLFKLGIVKSTDASTIADVFVNDVALINTSTSGRRLHVSKFRNLLSSTTSTGLQVNFSISLASSTPSNTVNNIKALGNPSSKSATSFVKVFPVLPMSTTVSDVEYVIEVDDTLVFDKCVSSTLGTVPEVPEKLLWPIALDVQFSPVSIDVTMDQSPMIYDVYDTRASIAMKLRTQSFDISVLLLEQQPGSDDYVSECTCDNELYSNTKCDSSNAIRISKQQIIQNGFTIDKSKLYSQYILCAKVNKSKFGRHGHHNEATNIGVHCDGYLEELLLKDLKPSTIYHIFFVAHAGTQSSKPYSTVFQTKDVAPVMTYNIPAVRSDGFTLTSTVDPQKSRISRFLYMIIPQNSLEASRCESATPWQMANLIHGYAVTRFEDCNANIVCRGVETFEASGQKQIRLETRSLLNKNCRRFKVAERLVVFLLGEYNYSETKGFHGAYYARVQRYVHLAHHNITLSSVTLPENKSKELQVFVHQNYGPKSKEFLDFSCYLTGYTTNVYFKKVRTPVSTENNLWNVQKHEIGKLIAVEDKNNSEIALKRFAVTCYNNVANGSSVDRSDFTYQEQLRSTTHADSHNVVWPNWSDSYMIKDDGKSKYHFEDHVESLTTVGNQTFIFQQNHPEWIGLMFMQELQLIVHNISISLLQISNDGRSFNFSMPQYDLLCPTDDECARDGGYRRLYVGNPRNISIPHIKGSLGGFYDTYSVYSYRQCENAALFSSDPNVCWDSDQSSKECAFGSGTDCKKCPEHSICPGGPRAWPHPRYWNKDDYSDEVVRCSQPSLKRCIAHDRVERSVICGETYDNSSYACEECAQYHYAQWNQCVKCPKYYQEKTSIMPSLIRAIVYVFAAVFGLNIAVYFSIIGVGGTIISSWYLTKRFLLEIIFYIQLIAVAAKPIYPLQTMFSKGMSYVFNAFLAEWEIFIPISCFEAKPANFFADRILMTVALLLLGLFIVLTSEHLQPKFSCVRRSTRQLLKNKIMPYARYWNLVALGVMYTPVSVSVFSLLMCTSDRGILPRLKRDISIVCDTAEHQAISQFAYVTLAAYVIGFPLFSSIYVYNTFFGNSRKQYMERSKLTVFEFWMNDDFQHWRHRDRLWFFVVVCALSFSSTYFTSVDTHIFGLVFDLVLLSVYLLAVFRYSPQYSKIYLKERIIDAFVPDQNSSKGGDTVPQHFIGPLSKKIMINPVKTANGQTYERAMIGKWFARGNVTDPVSQQPLKSLHLSPATSLKKEITLWKSKRKKKASVKERSGSFASKSGWKGGEELEKTKIVEEVYERELAAELEDMVRQFEDEENRTKNISLRFKAHMVLKKSTTTFALKSIRLILTSESDPFFNLQEECTAEAYDMIRDQFELMATFEEFPRLLASMLDRSADQGKTFKIVITPALENLEFAQLGIRNLTMKGQFSDVLVLNLMPSKYIPKIPWLYIGKLGSIVTAICMAVWSHILTVTYETSTSDMNPDYMFAFDTSVSATFYVYVCTMLLLYQFVSNRFGKKMHIADENRRILAGKGDNTLDEDEKLSDVQVWNKSKEKSLRAKYNNLKLSKGPISFEAAKALGDLGLHLIDQPDKLKEGMKVLRETLRALSKAGLGVNSPVFTRYQGELLKCEKAVLKDKIKNKNSITNVEDGMLPEIIDVHAFENNKAQLWGSWFGSHETYKSKHTCAVVAQRIRSMIILTEGLSVILLSYFDFPNSTWFLIKSISMLVIEILFLAIIDHKFTFKNQKIHRSHLLLVDVNFSALFFAAAVSSVYGLATIGLTYIIAINICLQALTMLLSFFMFLSVGLEISDNVWLWLLQKCRRRRQNVRKRRNTMKRRSMKYHFSNTEMKSGDVQFYSNPMAGNKNLEMTDMKKKRRSRRQTSLNSFEEVSDVASVQNVINPLLALKRKKETRKSRESSRSADKSKKKRSQRVDTDDKSKRDSRRERRSRREKRDSKQSSRSRSQIEKARRSESRDDREARRSQTKKARRSESRDDREARRSQSKKARRSESRDDREARRSQTKKARRSESQEDREARKLRRQQRYMEEMKSPVYASSRKNKKKRSKTSR